ncbi:MAG: ABC transporter ATP-binding protein [Anaerolineae bacterium]|nr:ABC transporter ATP-binding protein [Candidatus Roseilinea sp.]MDW8448389.1 ABC transporter ATP-binding protein [Anaerolineae bacterium]
MEALAIEVKGVSAHYGAGRRRVEALKDVSVEVRRGEIFGLLGPNGAGKTTLLSCIEGLHRLDRGSICVAGIDVLHNSRPAKRKLGVQLQSTALMEGLTALELLKAYAALYEVYPTRAALMALLARFGLAEQAHKRAKQMSGGQQQRLALAIALVTDPQIVLLDEPTSALDPHARRALWEMIHAIHEEGRTIIITTHNMDEAESLCSRVAIMDAGRIVACDTPSQLIASTGARPVLRAAIELPPDDVQPLAGAVQMRRAGEYLEVETVDPTATLQSLYELAARHSRAVRDIVVRQPNLEAGLNLPEE